MNSIVIKGAREHNLQGIDVEIPRDKLVVVTGLSGSGKSSLAFDTVYAEGQRRYVESLSAYARQFLGQNDKPDVDTIEGLSPAISIEQKSTGRNPRSTVGTLTEIYDHLRLLYARVGDVHCFSCGKPIAAQTVQQMVDTVLSWPARTKFMVLAPVVRDRKGEYRKELGQFRRDGYVRVRVDGEMRELEEEITLDKKKKHSIDLVVDRLILKEDIRRRLTDAIELSLRVAEGLVRIAVVDGEETLLSERFSCHDCGISYPELSPRMFSFNSPYGACAQCGGLGFSSDFDLGKLIPDPSLSLSQGAIAPWSSSTQVYADQALQSLAAHYGQSMDTAWNKLPKKFRDVVLHGSGSESIKFRYERERHAFHFDRPFEGVIPSLQRRHRETQSERSRESIEEYMSRQSCQSCGGTRLKQEALAVKVGGLSVAELCALNINEILTFCQALTLDRQKAAIAERVLKEVVERLQFLLSVGLSYLSLERSSATLSGGEAQRIRLATQIGSALRGVIYVLDEPSIGLHQRDNARLLSTLTRLRDLGNTVLVVEHDQETIESADHIIDMGPGAGIHGGRVVVAGSVQQVKACPASLTGDYLAGRRKVHVPSQRRTGRGDAITVKNARGNNLRGIDVSFPLGQLVCVTGVSGSGKSTLVTDTLFPAVAAALGLGHEPAAPHDSVVGVEHVDKVIDIDQSPIGRTPRSNPATYTQVFASIRDLFAGLPESRARGYKSGRYSFNVKGGRCEACEGDGIIRIEMHFLPDVFVTCEQCAGRRYNRETLEVLYRGQSIADVLDMTVDEAATFLSAVPAVSHKLETLQAVGLGYIKLGQSATTLSGGEAQRIKLSRELSRRSTGRTLFILDEPTTGLHFHDVDRLLHVLHALVDKGNTVVVIEHNLDVIKTADHVIDLGPEGGSGGGQRVATGTPEQVAATRGSHTGAYLAAVLGQGAAPAVGRRSAGGARKVAKARRPLA